jgi:uncharacterized OB-fold protein
MNNTVAIWRKTRQVHNLLGKKGKLVVWTKIYIAPEGFEQNVPYVVGLIKFEDGKTVPLQVVDCDEKTLQSGQEVVAVVRRLGDVQKQEVIQYGIKVQPVGANDYLP